MPASTSPAVPDASGQVVITFDKVEVGNPMPTYTDKGVTFSLAAPPQRSRAQGRIVFFPHLKTDKNGVLNAMANEQGIPVKVDFGQPVTSVTLEMWGTPGCHALVEAHDKDGKLIDSAKLPNTVPQRESPSDPVPSFKLTVKGQNIAYILFGGAPDGEALVADEIRFTPQKKP